MKLGKANYGAMKKIFKIEDGDNVYRILPPMGDLADKGIWSKYYSVAWGYRDSKGKMRPFVDPSERNRSNGMMESVSAALAKRNDLEAKKKQMKEANATKEQMKAMNEILMNFNIEGKYYVNAINLKGEIGLLKLGSKAFKALVGDRNKNEKGLIDRLMDKGIDPISSLDNGRMFNFYRQGTALDTTYTVTVYQEAVQVNGEEYKKDKVHVIDDTVISRLDKESFDLGKLFPTPTLEEVKRIVEEGPSAVDAILGTPAETASATTTTEEVVEDVAEEVAPVSAAVAQEPKSQPAVTPAPAAQAATTTPASTPAAAAFDPDEFLRSMGAKIG